MLTSSTLSEVLHKFTLTRILFEIDMGHIGGSAWSFRAALFARIIHH